MYKLRIYCNDIYCDGTSRQYWEDGNGTYETYDKALIECYKASLEEVQGLMETSDCYKWFEIDKDFEITEAYKNNELKDIVSFPIATILYDHAPWDRENDCEIKIITGYDIVEV
jgi:hypothetical protein